jgi:zinc protease
MSRRLAFPALLFIVALLFCAAQARSQAADWKQIHPPPLHSFVPQAPARVQLPNGMVFLLEEDHELPFITVTGRIRGGSLEEPADKVGLAGLYGQIWRTGGTKDQTGDQLDDFLEARAAKIETFGGAASTTISMNCLRENWDEVFKLFVDLLRNPEFRQEKFALAKSQLSTGIARRNDQPFQIAFRESSKLVYGPDSPYARTATYATIANVNRQDVLDWHKKYVQPNNIILAIHGDFDVKKMEAALLAAFSSWLKGPADNKPKFSFPGPKPGVYFVQKDDVTASTIQMVDLGITRDNPDYYAIEVFNEFFGGSFGSRLFTNIRSKKGLAYTVGGSIGSTFDHPGMIRLSMSTKSGSTGAAIDALNVELDALKTSPVTPEELARAKDAILNSFVFRFDSREKVLDERLDYEFYGYPSTFLERYRTGIEKVTQADVARAVEKYVHKDRLAILVVGKAQDFDRPLASFGPVTTLDISIPAPPSSK